MRPVGSPSRLPPPSAPHQGAPKDGMSHGITVTAFPFAKNDVVVKSRRIPYALSAGVLSCVGHSRARMGRFKLPHPLTPGVDAGGSGMNRHA